VVAASSLASMFAAWEPPASAIYATYAGNPLPNPPALAGEGRLGAG
jgi:hypothetical protein